MASNRRQSTTSAGGGAGSGSVDFILRTAMERQSGNKRPIRPKLVDDTLLGDDSDDSDFNVDDHESVSGSDITKDSNCSDDDENGSDDSKDDSDNSNSESEVPEEKPSLLRETMKKLNNESPDFHPPGGSKAKKKKKKPKAKKVPAKIPAKKKEKKMKSKKSDKSAATTQKNLRKSNPYAGCVMDRVFKATSAMRDIRSDIDLYRKICSFCLGEKSDAANEIVECDSCKVTVHEGCYGICDGISNSSDISSSSATEPWFCDFCKNPDNYCAQSCAICPNPGGLLKATAEDQFVHLVCAHYTRGILSLHDNKAYLEKIAYSRWGNKPCTLCSSGRYATTGITVECDAGLCKQYVHISCAQRFGLLSDPFSSGGTEEADSLYASCKLHGQKEQAKHRATLFKVLQEQIRIKREKANFSFFPSITTVNEKQTKLQQKLQKIQGRLASKRIIKADGSSLVSYSVKGHKLPYRRSCLLESKRKPRNLKSCAYSVSSFSRKIENMGEDLTSLELEGKNERIVANIKKRWNVLPSLTVEYVAYYFDRETRIEALSKQCQELLKENTNLNDRQVALNTVLENEAVDHMEIIDDTLTMNKELIGLKKILTSVCPNNKTVNTSAILKGLPPQRPKSPVRKQPVSVPKQSEKKTSNAGSTGTELKKTVKRVSLPPTGPGRLTLYICAKCKKSDQQHLITNCDTCKLYFHLGCLDPPLLRMPRRSKLQGWECADCSEPKTEEEEVIDTEAPRTLRGRTQLKRPEKYRETEESEDEPVIVKEKPAGVKPPIASPLQPPTQNAADQFQPIVVPINIMGIRPLPDLIRLKVPPVVANGPTTTKIIPTAVAVHLTTPTQPPSGSANGGVPPVYTNVNVLKRTNPVGFVRSATSPLGAKKLKLEAQGTTVTKVEMKTPKTSSTPVVSPTTHRLIPVVAKVNIKREKLDPNQDEGVARKLRTPKASPTAKPLVFPAKLTPIAPNPNSADANGVTLVQKTAPCPASKKMKLVLSPVNSERGTKNGVAAPVVTPRLQMQTPAQHPHRPTILQTKRGATTIFKAQTSPTLAQAGTCPAPVKVRKSSPKPGQRMDKTNLNNSSTEDGTTLGSTETGKCSVCNKTEEKNSLVMCDDCKLDFHFLCAPPFMPYNPKRRGYTWYCDQCAKKSDEDVEVSFVGEARGNKTGGRKH